MKWLYFILDGAAFAGPLALSFDQRVNFYSKWKTAFLSILFMMFIFIPLDSIFTYYQIWGFNDKYISGYKLAYLPIEEWLFFPATHFAILFVHECLYSYIKKDPLSKSYKYVLLPICAIGIMVSFIYPHQLYTSLKMGGASILTLVFLFVVKSNWLSRFTLTFLVSLIPFFLMNSILTGSLIEEEIVWYNSDHILNIRIGTIPIEDVYYNLFMLLTTTYFYERFRSRMITS